ncbi:MAG: cytochrome c [Deltaproteobacteria bacterium]|nr:cytochrome c [Deltaproteobacteria bacterium]
MKWILLIAPLVLSLMVFSDASSAEKKVRKVIHSTPPLDYVGLENPLTSADPKTLPDNDPNILAGKRLYGKTCAVCHGVRSDGKGPEAEGFVTPIRPVDLTDPDAIAMLDQSYVLWRIDDGGLDEPFYSAMPGWKDDFTETEKWQIILYLYKNAGVSPKAKN